MYLRTRDYDPAILSPNLSQIITNSTVADLGIRLIVENYAKGIVYSHLKQKYYLDWEFTDTNIYSRYSSGTIPATFNSGSRVEFNFSVYVAANTYNIGDTCSYINGTIVNQYICNTNGTTGAFDASKWYLVGFQYDLWYVQMPYELFSVYRNYHIGDLVFWKGKIFTCLQETQDLWEGDILDAITISNVPLPNNFPGDNSTASINQWGQGVTYTFSVIPLSYSSWSGATNYLKGNIINHNNVTWIASTGTVASPNLNNEPGADTVNWTIYSFNGIAPGIPYSTPWSQLINYTAGQLVVYNNILYSSIFGTASVPNAGNVPGTDTKNWVPLIWAFGDNRDQIILPLMIAITLKLLHERIPPKQIPELRQLAYDAALKTLHDIAHGELNADKLQPFQSGAGQTVTYVGVTKEQNTW